MATLNDHPAGGTYVETEPRPGAICQVCGRLPAVVAVTVDDTGRPLELCEPDLAAAWFLTP